MNGVLGCVGVRVEAPADALAQMSMGRCFATDSGVTHALGAEGMPTTAAIASRGGRVVALSGHPYWADGQGRVSPLPAVGERLLDAWTTRGAETLSSLHGDYALALIEPARAYALLAVDRMSVRNIVYAQARGGLVFGPTCDTIARFPGLSRDVDPQSIFNYLYFHMVPGPATVFRGWRRVPPGCLVELVDGHVNEYPHWRPKFIEARTESFSTLKQRMRDALEDGVRTAADGQACGAFLSGGTDSSTIAGLLGTLTATQAKTFSIGFDAAGYDEMDYARLASRRFGTLHHEHYVTPDEVVDAIPLIAQAYDQPFGNASAVPTYYCAKLARDHGIVRMLGGDGGDELFGGNARYARQSQFARYDRIPSPLRRWLIEPLASRLPFTASIPLARKAKSYVAQASQPMPDRYESYNLLERLGIGTVFEPDFLASVATNTPRAQMREVWAAADAGSLINRMLALDFQFTLADNDLPKVTRMCELAGVDVAFPMLHDPLIDFSLALPPDHKLRGSTLRWFFKEALADFLPEAIRTKQKHGFGLPVGVWMQEHRRLRELVSDSLGSLAERRVVRADFLARLMRERLAEHPGYYGTMAWVLMMLELWFQRHVELTLARDSR